MYNLHRTVCGGGKGGKAPKPDPQIGKAALAASAVAEKAQAFSERYYDTVITPLLRQQSEASATAQTKLGDLYDINAAQMRTSNDRYKQLGIPAEDRYYKMVSDYSEPEEMERQALAAKGDVAVAQQNQQGQMRRQMAAMGIDPSSPAAMAMMSDQAMMGAAAEATAMNRARGAARTLGMQLTSDAANFGRGGQSGILQFGAGAQGNATGAFGVANQALGTGMNAGQGVQQGYQTALSGYNNIMNTYAKVYDTQMQGHVAKMQQPGFGSFLGTIGGALAGNTGLF